MKFKLLRGLHSHGGRLYEVGDVVESSVDLRLSFNCPGSLKFELVDDGTPVKAPVVPVHAAAAQEAAEQGYPPATSQKAPEGDETPLERMTAKQLRDHAEWQGIGLARGAKKAEILQLLQEALVTE